MHISFVSIFYCSLFSLLVLGENCDRLYGENSFSCVCKDITCDTIGEIPLPDPGFYKVLTSSKDEFRFDVQEVLLEVLNLTETEYDARIFVKTENVRQKMLGFGGAFTDSSGLNMVALTSDLQELLIRHYFAPEGIEYNVARVPIAGTDFSTHPYSYDDVDGDIQLKYFSLAQEDYLYKIPFIKQAIEVSNRNLRFFASPWSPPSWMKTNGMFNGTGGLLEEMQQPWANYFIKFFDAYKSEDINFWGLTVQNEPTMGLVNDHAWNACGFSPEQERDFVKNYLGPTLTSSAYNELSVMISDDSRQALPLYPNVVLADNYTYQLVDGIAVHWYADRYIPVTVVSQVHRNFPDKYILYTEACFENLVGRDNAVKLGSWKRAERYAYDIITNVNHWSSGWVDWNLALDTIGGPNWASNNVDSPVIINSTANEFYKQPMFYALGHFSKFVSEGSFSLETSVTNTEEEIYSTSFLTPSNYVVVVVLSMSKSEQRLLLEDDIGNQILATLPARSIHTFVYSGQ